MRIGADDDRGREKLVRYCARPAFALERLTVLKDGRVAYAIKTARRGATHRILTPVELLARIAALIPPPRQPFLLRRTYDVDVLVCPRCRGPARIVAAITEPAVIRKILAHVREPPARAPPSGAREPELDDAADGEAWVEPEVDVG